MSCPSLRALLILALPLLAPDLAQGAQPPAPREATPPRPAPRSADEAMYDARYGTTGSLDPRQVEMERAGATGGAGQHG